MKGVSGCRNTLAGRELPKDLVQQVQQLKQLGRRDEKGLNVFDRWKRWVLPYMHFGAIFWF